jgi:hypothetical protein
MALVNRDAWEGCGLYLFGLMVGLAIGIGLGAWWW